MWLFSKLSLFGADLFTQTLKLAQNLKNFSENEALVKIQRHCAYQERSHHEVKEKLYSMGLFKESVEKILAELIESDYLNEERFALAYAGGKFRMKQWGRMKIREGLMQKKVSAYCLKKALASIPEEDYVHTVQKLAEKKWQSLNKKSILEKKAALYQYLFSKGFEKEYIYAQLETLVKKT